MQTAVLAVADLAVARGALTYFAPSAVLLLEGNVLIVLLALTIAGIAVGERLAVGGVGLVPVLLLLAYLLGIYLLQRHEGKGRWQPVDPPPVEEASPARSERMQDWTLRRLGVAFALASLVILLAGATLAQAADAIAVQSGLGASFVGASLLAASTSLPEVSTTLAAVRMGAYAMAISNIFGSNMIMVALLLPADLAYRKGPILAAVDEAALFTIAVGIGVTALYLVGMIERRNRTFLRMGIDSVAVLVVYLASLVVLFFMR
jgi:cation:H+ antiporter